MHKENFKDIFVLSWHFSAQWNNAVGTEKAICLLLEWYQLFDALEETNI